MFKNWFRKLANKSSPNLSVSPTIKIRKQIYDLSLDDIITYPIWEFALDEEGEENQDEATVRPVPFTDNFDPNNGTFIIRASFHLNDSTKVYGHLTTPGKHIDDLGYIQPSIVTSSGQIQFWCGMMEPSRSHIVGAYSNLGKTPEEIFPISFSSDLALKHAPITGRIEGFLVKENFNTSAIRVLR